MCIIVWAHVSKYLITSSWILSQSKRAAHYYNSIRHFKTSRHMFFFYKNLISWHFIFSFSKYIYLSTYFSCVYFQLLFCHKLSSGSFFQLRIWLLLLRDDGNSDPWLLPELSDGYPCGAFFRLCRIQCSSSLRFLKRQ